MKDERTLHQIPVGGQKFDRLLVTQGGEAILHAHGLVVATGSVEQLPHGADGLEGKSQLVPARRGLSDGKDGWGQALAQEPFLGASTGAATCVGIHLDRHGGEDTALNVICVATEQQKSRTPFGVRP